MATITISKKEYQNLVNTKLKFEYLRNILRNDFFSPPPTKNKKAVLEAFRSAEKYNKRFLKSLENGLSRSSYFRQA
jgi:hypothetical protein